jgi:hypothetical protein
LGRNQPENDRLLALARSRPDGEWTLLEPDNFQGPTALIVGPQSPAALAAAAAEIAARSRGVARDARLVLTDPAGTRRAGFTALSGAEAAKK